MSGQEIILLVGVLYWGAFLLAPLYRRRHK